MSACIALSSRRAAAPISSMNPHPLTHGFEPEAADAIKTRLRLYPALAIHGFGANQYFGRARLQRATMPVALVIAYMDQAHLFPESFHVGNVGAADRRVGGRERWPIRCHSRRCRHRRGAMDDRQGRAGAQARRACALRRCALAGRPSSRSALAACAFGRCLMKPSFFTVKCARRELLGANSRG